VKKSIGGIKAWFTEQPFSAPPPLLFLPPAEAELKALLAHPAFRDRRHRESAAVRAGIEALYATLYPGNELRPARRQGVELVEVARGAR
jgi:hypothetical protein